MSYKLKEMEVEAVQITRDGFYNPPEGFGEWDRDKCVVFASRGDQQFLNIGLCGDWLVRVPDSDYDAIFKDCVMLNPNTKHVTKVLVITEALFRALFTTT